jgi:hypothetical protein
MKQKAPPFPRTPQQGAITSFLDSSKDEKYKAHHPDQVRKCNSFVEHAIIGCGLPLSVMENPHFLQFLKDLDPKFSLPSRKVVSTKIIPKLHDNTMDKVVGHLQLAQYVALTLDIWTDRRQHSYLGITAHTFLDCIPHSLLLLFSSFKGSHTGSRIASAVEKAISDFGLQRKVYYCSCDNASNMVKAFSVLNELAVGEFPFDDDDNDDDIPIAMYANVVDDEDLWHDLSDEQASDVNEGITRACTTRLSCFAHSLQLVVKDGMNKLTSARTLLSKCSKLSSTLHQSALLKEAFEARFGALRSIPEANSTRWSSLFHQLHSIVQLDQAALKDILHQRNLSNLVMTPANFSCLEELVSILASFAEVTDAIQGDQYPTLGCVVPSLVSLHKILSTQCQTAQYHKVFARALLDSLVTRFRGLYVNVGLLPGNPASDGKAFGDFVYIMAAVMDPMYNFIWLDVDHTGTAAFKRELKTTITGMD